MGAYLVYGKGVPKTMRFDVVVSETHRFANSVTENPVETGPNVTDNVRAELDTISLEVFVSNAPIGTGNLLKPGLRGQYTKLKLDIPEYKAPLAPTPGAVFGAVTDAVGSAVDSITGSNKKPDGAVTLQFSQEFDSVAEVLTELRKLRDTAEIVKVITPHWDYSSMVVLSVDMPRTSAEGDGARFTIELKQILQVETKRTSEPVPTQTRGKKKKNSGTKGAAEPEQGSSKAYEILESAKNYLKPSTPGL